MSAWKEMQMAKSPEEYEEAKRNFESECREEEARDRAYYDDLDRRDYSDV